MTAGLPGVGIGGMFYLFSAVLMPFHCLIDTLRGRESRWGPAINQAFLALGALGAVWATGFAVGWVMLAVTPALVVGARGATSGIAVPNAVRAAALLGSIGTLMIVLAMVQVMRLVLPSRLTPRALVPEIARQTQSAA